MDYQLFQQIQNLINRDKIDMALKMISAALTDYPDSDELYSLQASAYLKVKDFKHAQQSINTGIGLNPENDFLFYLSAHVALEYDNYKQAEEQIDQAIGLNPYSATFFGTKSMIFINQKKYTEAIEAALSGLDLDPDDPMCNNMLSMAQTRAGLSGEAFNRLENMLADDPENELTQANTGYYYLRQGDARKAKEHFAAALNADPEYDFARTGMLQAIKSTNWFYRKLLQFSYWLDEINSKYRWGFIIGLVLIVKVVPILSIPYLIFVFWTWFTGPLSDMIIYFDKYGRYLMKPRTIMLTRINIAVFTLGLLSLAAGLMLHGSFLLMAFAFLLTTIPVYISGGITKPLNRLALGAFALAYIASGLWGVYLGYFMNKSVELAITALIISAVIFSWTLAFIKK
ncbi:tetratricopeptide repeat protein [Mucilaginibacter terrae]|uniref:Tfp pilus assembly protein PilF n=1 Tax=Mucilaginibacter terrae TaxID=1955052 RepID=A0ABU3GNY2_9SPHI|nr:tetratricopeptide repeat protein [Mucilaginibacter terrae]MDT3401483.1 Tfp pilus assembly protein PilF [Mucilaginibacter terrae]